MSCEHLFLFSVCFCIDIRGLILLITEVEKKSFFKHQRLKINAFYFYLITWKSKNGTANKCKLIIIKVSLSKCCKKKKSESVKLELKVYLKKEKTYGQKKSKKHERHICKLKLMWRLLHLLQKHLTCILTDQNTFLNEIWWIEVTFQAVCKKTHLSIRKYKVIPFKVFLCSLSTNFKPKINVFRI